MLKLLIILLLLVNIVEAQFKFQYVSEFREDNTLIVDLIAQNLGRNEEIWSIYGKNLQDRFVDTHNFFITYLDAIYNSRKKIIPDEILIKTKGENYYPMSRPTYYFVHTGENYKQEWRLIFNNISKEMLDLSVVVFGEELKIKDIITYNEIESKRDEILNSNLSKALISMRDESWNVAIKFWNECINLDESIAEKYYKEISKCYFENSISYFQQNNLDESLDLYLKGKTFNNQLSEKYSQIFSDLYFALGIKEIDNSEVEKGINSLQESYSLSIKNQKKIQTYLGNKQINTFTSFSLSILPGLSQLIIQKNSVKSFLTFSGFTFFSVLAITNNLEANKLFKDLQTITDPVNFKLTKEEAEQKDKNSKISTIFVLGTILYSIIDQFIYTSNNNIDFSLRTNSNGYLSSNNEFRLSLNFKITL